MDNKKMLTYNQIVEILKKSLGMSEEEVIEVFKRREIKPYIKKDGKFLPFRIEEIGKDGITGSIEH